MSESIHRCGGKLYWNPSGTVFRWLVYGIAFGSAFCGGLGYMIIERLS